MSNAGDGDGDDPHDSDNTMDNEGDMSYIDLLYQMSRAWLSVQLTHEVSVAATDAFWAVAITNMKKLLEAKANEGITRKIPMFQNQRKILFEKECPAIEMTFAYMHNETQRLHIVKDDKLPRKNFDSNPAYTKLYETACVKVRISCHLLQKKQTFLFNFR